MKYIFKQFLIVLFVSFLFWSCEPFFSVEYSIENHSSHSLEIQSQNTFQDSASIHMLVPDASLVIFYDDKLGSSPNNFLDQLSQLPFEQVHIRTINGLAYNKDELDINYWKKTYPEDTGNSDLGSVNLEILDSDF